MSESDIIPENRTVYLGDGLYAKEERGMIKLMANSHEYPSDIVYLEPDVLVNLMHYAEKVGML